MNNEHSTAFIYTHVPKCGGTSFRNYIFTRANEADIDHSRLHVPGFGGIENDKNLDQMSPEELNSLRKHGLLVLADHSPFNGHKFHDIEIVNPFFYTILRDPYARFMSHYNFFYYHLGYSGCQGKQLSDLDAKTLDAVLDQLSNVQVKFLAGYDDRGDKEKMPIDQLYYVAKYNLKYRMGAVGILERLEESLNYLCDIGPVWLRDKKLNMEKKNVTKRVEKDSISDELNQRIFKCIEQDIKLYNVGLTRLDQDIANFNKNDEGK